MTVARSQIVDVDVTPWYHAISKCVRGAFLLKEGQLHRKDWIEQRLHELTRLFTVDVAGFSILDNHLHVLVRLDPKRAEDWSPEEVVRRWLKLFPPRGKDRKTIQVTPNLIKAKARDGKLVGRLRQRLGNLGWFMKCLKEPIARLANKEDGTTGAFWQSRYKSIAILDEESLLATCVYIDLNPVAAGLVGLPEESPHTSIKTRVEHCRAKGRMRDLQAARQGTVAGVKPGRGLEAGLWLLPVEDRRRYGDKRAGLLEDYSLGSYLQLVDWTSRLVRKGKARVSPEVKGMLERLGTSVEVWEGTIHQLFARSMPLGVAFAFSRDRLRAAAEHRGCHHLANLNGCAA
jgi:hypothetical protein